MKNDFWFFTVLLILSRVLDFYSTSLWFFQPDGIKGETNPLTRFFGVGWTGLILVNIVLILAIIWAYYFYSYGYQPVKIENPPDDFKAYISRLYFGTDNAFHKIFYTVSNNRNISIAHMGYALIRVVILGSILATIHNLCQFYNVELYNTFRHIVKRPLYVIYGIVILSMIYFQYKVLSIEYYHRYNAY